VPVRFDKRVYINSALIFNHHYVGVQIEGLVLIKDDDTSFIRLLFVEESDVGSLKGLLAHVHHGAVPLLEVDLEIQGVLCPH
jgi:hypothetical protein